MRPSRLARPAEVACWWLVLTGMWLVTTTSTTVIELLVGAGVALPCALGAVLARRASGARWSLDVRWVRWLALLPVAMVQDLPRAARLLLPESLLPGPLLPEPRGGELRELPMPRERRERSLTRRALAALLVSATPGSYLVDSPERRPVLVVHALGPPGRLEREVSR